MGSYITRKQLSTLSLDLQSFLTNHSSCLSRKAQSEWYHQFSQFYSYWSWLCRGLVDSLTRAGKGHPPEKNRWITACFSNIFSCPFQLQISRKTQQKWNLQLLKSAGWSRETESLQTQCICVQVSYKARYFSLE